MTKVEEKNNSWVMMSVVVAVALLAVMGLMWSGQMENKKDVSDQMSTTIIEMMNVDSSDMMSKFTGKYSAELPAATGPGRLISLELMSDGKAQMISDYQNGENAIIESGNWKSISDDSFEVSLNMMNGEMMASPIMMTFMLAKMNQNNIVLIDYDMSIWGENGLVLNREQAVPKVLKTEMSWVWEMTQMSDNEVFKPMTEKELSIKFMPNGILEIKTDCNNVFGNSYTVGTDEKISLMTGASSMMYCEGAMESEFTRELNEVESYMIKDGKLILMLRMDSGTMTFRK